MSELYDLKFAKDTVQIILDQIEDLEKWSVYNGDSLNQETHELRSKAEAIQTTLNGRSA